MDRAKTGIDGLDKVLFGGIPRNSTVLVSGSCGSGKTILGLQFLYKGALAGEPALYVTFEESREKILEQTTQFNWDIPSLEKKNMFEIYAADTDDISLLLDALRDKVSKLKAKRLVIDSMTTMMEHGVIYRSKLSKDMSQMDREQSKARFPTKGSDVTRKDIYHLIGQINKLGATALLVSELAEKSDYLSRDTISEFAADGVILLQVNTVGGEHERLLSVRKMRGTKIDVSLFPMKFNSNGITVEE